VLFAVRFGASVDSQLSAVLEDGPGSVAALTILYLEVSSMQRDCAEPAGVRLGRGRGGVEWGWG